MPQVSFAVRNVFVYDGVTNQIVAGCRQFGNTSIPEFYECLDLLFVSPAAGQYRLFHRDTGTYLANDSLGALPIGNYVVCSQGEKNIHCWC